MNGNISKILIGKSRRFLAGFLPLMDAWRREFFPVLFKGMIQSGGLLVTEISRRVRDAGEDLAAVWQRVRRHVGSREWGKTWGNVQAEFARRHAERMHEMTPVVLDFSDLSKPYARKMEFLAPVRDADQSSLRGYPVVNPGYWLFETYVPMGPNGDPLPLVCFPFSLEDPGMGSQNHALQLGVDRLAAALAGMGIVIVDRGFDSDFFFKLMEERKMRFLCRLVGNRTLLDPDRASLGLADDVEARMPATHKAPFRIWRDHRWQTRQYLLKWRTVTLPDTTEPCSFVVAARADNPESRIMLLTNSPVRSVVDVVRLVRHYLLRWRAEDAMRLLKKDLGIETVRLADFNSVRRLVELAFWVLALITLVTADLTDRQRADLNRFVAAVPTPILLFHYRVTAALRLILMKYAGDYLSPRRPGGAKV